MSVTTRDEAASRRSFLKAASACSAACLLQPSAAAAGEDAILRFGLIADVHQDIMHDAIPRVRAFVATMEEEKVDFVCHLGDLCWPHERNLAFLAEWKKFPGVRHHVLGNHDMDGGFTREQTVAFYGMPHKHYSFDVKGVHFVVLDGNEPGGKRKGYKRHIAAEQRKWLAEDLAKTALSTIVFSHQPLDTGSGIENCDAVRKILEKATTEDGARKVVACFCGHFHDDYMATINGISYIRVNSASNYWLGQPFQHESYSKEIHEKFPWICNTAPYKDPLWAVVEVDLAKGNLTVKGRETEWVGPSPWEVGADEKRIPRTRVAPKVSNRVIHLGAKG